VCVGGGRRGVNGRVCMHSEVRRGFASGPSVACSLVGDGGGSKELTHLAGSPTPWVSPSRLPMPLPNRPYPTPTVRNQKKRPTSLVGGERPGDLALGGRCRGKLG
jgi:hypothetical protein